MKFNNHKNRLDRPLIVYADVESTLVKQIINWYPRTCPKRMMLWLCLHLWFYSKYIMVRCKYCVENMIKELNRLAYKCINKMKHDEYMKMDIQYIIKASVQSTCHICNKCFKDDDVKCRDHDHRTGSSEVWHIKHEILIIIIILISYRIS